MSDLNILVLSNSDKTNWDDYHRIKEEQIFHPICLVYDRNHSSFYSDKHQHIVLQKNAITIGIAHLEFLTECEVVLRTIAIDTPYQSQGYGTILMNLLEISLKDRLVSTIKLNAGPKAENFYRKLGYKDIIWNDISINPQTIKLGKSLLYSQRS